MGQNTSEQEEKLMHIMKFSAYSQQLSTFEKWEKERKEKELRNIWILN
jgi:hypothetical protein